MSTASTLLFGHAYLVLFVYVLLSQMGLPLPSGPLILAAGALAAAGRMRITTAMTVVVAASLCADSAWYHLGRARGARVLRLLCRLSLEPDVCVRRTQGALGRHGASFLLIAKFLPGLGLLAAPVAGQTGMRYRRFLAFDAAGALIWAGAYTSLGFLLGEGVGRSATAMWAAAKFGAAAVLGGAIVLVAVRLMRRRQFRKRTAIPRITPGELKERLDGGEAVYIVDLRHWVGPGADSLSLPGAVRLTAEEVLADKHRLPTDREIVLFCDCPGEASAALVAAALRRKGFARARPLKGGLDGWRLAGYALARGDDALD